MEIFLVLIVVGVLWFLTKLIYQSNSNVLSNSKYKNDLAKQEKELEEHIKIYGSTPIFPETPKKPEIRKIFPVINKKNVSFKLKVLLLMSIQIDSTGIFFFFQM